MDTTRAVPSAARGEEILLSKGASCLYIADILQPGDADAIHRELAEETPWDTNVTGAFRRPRRTFWIGDFAYAYSGVVHHPAPWTPTLDRIRRDLEAAIFGESAGQFRGVLMNLYRDGKDAIGFHADDEPEIEPESPIASVSLGAVRKFVLEPKKKRIAPSDVHLKLAHGSCLVMRGRTQLDWRHGIPAEPHVVGTRVNLTFRKYRERDVTCAEALRPHAANGPARGARCS